MRIAVLLFVVLLMVAAPASALGYFPCSAATCGGNITATIDVNYTFTGAPGTSALVTNIGNKTVALLDFTIPEGVNGTQGYPGPQGPIGLPNMTAGVNSTIIVNATFTGAANTNAIVVNVGTPENAALDFTIPGGMMNQTPNMTILIGSTWYDHNQASPDIAGYKIFNRTYPYDGTGTSTAVALLPATEYLIDSFVTNAGDPGLNQLPAGERIWYTNARVSSLSGGDSFIVIRLFKRDLAGNEVELYNLTTLPLTTTTLEYVTTKSTPYDIPMNTTDRFVAKYYALTNSAANPTITLYYDGVSYLSRATSPIIGTAGPQGPQGETGPMGPTGGTGGQVLYFWNNATPDIAGYEGLKPIPAGNTEVVEQVTVNSGTGQVLVDPYVTVAGYPGLTTLPAGLWRFRTFHNVSGASGTTTAVFKVYNRTAGGTETLLFTATSDDINSLTPTEYLTSYVQNADYTILSTDRIVVKVYGQSTHSANIIFNFIYEGSTHTSHILTPIAIGASDLVNYAYLPGRNLGQVLTGGTGANDDLILNGTSSTTKTSSYVILQPGGGNVGINISTSESQHPNPSNQLDVGGSISSRLGGNYLNEWQYNALTFGYYYPYYSWIQSGGSNPNVEQLRINPSGGNVYFSGSGTKVSIGLFNPTGQFQTNGVMRFQNLAGVCTVQADAGGNLSCISDEKYKDNIKPFTSGLLEVLKINPISYNWNAASKLSTKELNIGYSAQNLESANIGAVSTSKDVKYENQITKSKDGTNEEKTVESPILDSKGVQTETKTINLAAISAAQTNAIKELYQMIVTQQATIEAQQKEIDELKTRLDKAGIK